MIAHVSGIVLETRPDSAVISVGGIGVSVMCSPTTLAGTRVGESLSLHTSLIVREDSLTLFGFDSADSRELFDIVQSVSGFGPKLAFTVLSFLSADQLREAIANEDVAVLKSTPGVGAKGAQRLVLELKDKVGFVPKQRNSSVLVNSWHEQVLTGLVGLGFTQRDAQSALSEILSKGHFSEQDVSDVLRRALQLLGQP